MQWTLANIDFGRGFLFFNGAMYLVFAVWCTVATDGTAKAIGFRFANDGARSEYLVVYGGLELGMAVFFLLCGLAPRLTIGGLLFATTSYVALALYRAATVATLRPEGKFVYFMLAIEITFALLSAWLLRGAWKAAG